MKESLAVHYDVNRDRKDNVSSQWCGGVLATVGVVPPLFWVRLDGRGDDGWGRDLCFSIMAIFFRRVCRRVRIMASTFDMLANRGEAPDRCTYLS